VELSRVCPSGRIDLASSLEEASFGSNGLDKTSIRKATVEKSPIDGERTKEAGK